MLSSLGITITKLTSKFGILSRKACVRIATEAGTKAVDKSKELGRMLNKKEIEQIFVETVPKKCRPKLLTSNQEAIDVFRRTGHTEDEIKEFMSLPFGAAVLENGKRKWPIWIPFEKFRTELPKQMEMLMSSTIGHELEHALEKNNRVIEILRRKTTGIKETVCKFFDKNYKHRVCEREIEIHKFETEIQMVLLDCFDRKLGKFVCEPKIESIDKYLKEKNGIGLIERLRKFLHKNYANPQNSGSEQLRRFNKINFWLDMEKPAYQVTGTVDRYYFGIPNGETFITESISKGYEAAIDIVKKDRISYLKNLLFGKLKKPNIFATDNDILKYARTTNEKQVLEQLISGLNKDQKRKLIKVLYSYEGQPEAIKTIKTFLNKTTIKGNNIYLDKLELFEGINSQLLTNPNFIKIAKLANSKAKNSDAIIDMLHFLVQFNKIDDKIMRIYAGKLEKTIEKKGDIRAIVEQFCREIKSA